MAVAGPLSMHEQVQRMLHQLSSGSINTQADDQALIDGIRNTPALTPPVSLRRDPHQNADEKDAYIQALLGKLKSTRKSRQELAQALSYCLARLQQDQERMRDLSHQHSQCPRFEPTSDELRNRFEALRLDASSRGVTGQKNIEGFEKKLVTAMAAESKNSAAMINAAANLRAARIDQRALTEVISFMRSKKQIKQQIDDERQQAKRELEEAKQKSQRVSLEGKQRLASVSQSYVSPLSLGGAASDPYRSRIALPAPSGRAVPAPFSVSAPPPLEHDPSLPPRYASASMPSSRAALRPAPKADVDLTDYDLSDDDEESVMVERVRVKVEHGMSLRDTKEEDDADLALPDNAYAYDDGFTARDSNPMRPSRLSASVGHGYRLGAGSASR